MAIRLYDLAVSAPGLVRGAFSLGKAGLVWGKDAIYGSELLARLTPEMVRKIAATTPVKTYESGGSALVFEYNAAKNVAGASDDAGRYLYHYTNPKSADNILAKGFDTRYTADGSLYFTNKGNLSPIQAQIELALPANRQMPGSLLRIDAGALEKAGISPFIGPRRVQGNVPGLGSGGGTEFLFNKISLRSLSRK